VLDAAARTDKPVAVLSNVGSVIDAELAAQLRQAGIPVLEGMRTGLLALSHLLEHAAAPAAVGGAPSTMLAGSAALLGLLREYGIATVRAEQAADAQAAAAAADAIGYPVVLKTDEPGIAHKSDVGGVLLGLRGPKELAAGYADLAGRLGRRVLVCAAARPGVELALGIVRDPYLGPLIVVGAGGILVELLADRVVALPPVSAAAGGALC
jgi:acyl-CoA synthetase (NDP forming)